MISFLGAETLTPGLEYQINSATYQLLGAPDSQSLICFTTELGMPPVIIMFVASGSAYEIATSCGLLSTSAQEFIRGDCNANGVTDVADASYMLNYLFAGAAEPQCIDACDSSDGGTFDVADAVHLLASLFTGGPQPDSPFPFCGVDPTGDSLDCCHFVACP